MSQTIRDYIKAGIRSRPEELLFYGCMGNASGKWNSQKIVMKKVGMQQYLQLSD